MTKTTENNISDVLNLIKVTCYTDTIAEPLALQITSSNIETLH